MWLIIYPKKVTTIKEVKCDVSSKLNLKNFNSSQLD